MKRFKNSLNLYIGTYFFISNLFLVVLLGVILYFSWSKSLMKKNIDVTSSKIEKTANFLESYLGKTNALIDFIADNKKIQDFFYEKSEYNYKSIENLINPILKMDKNIKSISLIRKDGKIVSNNSKMLKFSNKEMKNKEWYKDSLSRMPVLNPIRQNNYKFTSTKDWFISITKEIKDKNGKHLGVVVFDISYIFLKHYLDRNNLKNNIEIVIFDKNDKIIFYKDIPCSNSKTDELKKFLNPVTKYKDFIVVKTVINNSDWKLVGIYNFKEIKELKLYFFKLIVITSLLSLIICFIINYFVIRRVTTPIKDFEKQVAEFSTTLEKITLKDNSFKEILNLKNCFNKMIDKINYLREYEIKSLYSQINPHFLYNTLDTIIWMAEFKDTEKVISITKSLANFFRLTLSEGREMITLSEEIEHIKEYLYIQKQRYEDKLEYFFEIDENLKNTLIPKLILQPLVENSIYHGIKNSEKNGLITIKTIECDNSFEILIIDNGIGFEKSKNNSHMKIGGIGIKNVDKRIKFFYGENYGVIIDENIKDGTVVRIVFPKKIF